MTSTAEFDRLNEIVAQLTRPATREWIVGRMAALLVHYYTAELPEKVNRAIGNDWAHELEGKPAWAISNACRWWMSADNSLRRKKPLPGDISERTDRELARIQTAKVMLERGVQPMKQIEAEPRGQAIPIERRRKVAQELLSKATASTKPSKPAQKREPE
ncbi:hypothetical protein BMI86_10200 [Thioclava sp. DLFJ5-1]|uniref:hypothetical protein n=1 Tax=Thioclava sp. DLFJ5-1 TaxID=1915314 RepID=UPI0009975E2A|nr:hypothetical protein [Thioclava sp. DLFJ5-1]OOY20868.1 hypothetical protein BMI86_10200 [Thioclava sp. DLFJ5-1]